MRNKIFTKNGNYIVTFAISIMSLFVSSELLAHAMLTLNGPTPPRYNSASIKISPPCGSPTANASLRTNVKTVIQQNAIVTVEWVETVNHGGSFVFDFASENDTGFAAIDTVSDDNVTRDLTIQFNYPPCTDCTLRMRQDMENAQNYYYSCADIAIVDPTDNTAPGEVTSITSTPASNFAQLDWTNPNDNDFYKVIIVRSNAALTVAPEVRTHYAVGDNIGVGTVIYNGNGPSFTDSGLISETQYTYTLFTVDKNYNYSNGFSMQSTTNAADLTPPGSVVVSHTPTTTSNSAQLYWTNPMDNDYLKTLVVRSSASLTASPIDRTFYEIGNTLGGGTIIQNSNATSLTDNALSSGTEYTYTLFALDSNYNYASGVEQLATTIGTSSGGGDTNTNDNPGTSSEDSGALFGLLFLLTGLIGVRRLQRKI